MGLSVSDPVRVFLTRAVADQQLLFTLKAPNSETRSAMSKADKNPLQPELLNHPLTGQWDGYRVSHIGEDFLLIYKLGDTGKHGLVVLVCLGTHAELFEQLRHFHNEKQTICQRMGCNRGTSEERAARLFGVHRKHDQPSSKRSLVARKGAFRDE